MAIELKVSGDSFLDAGSLRSFYQELEEICGNDCTQVSFSSLYINDRDMNEMSHYSYHKVEQEYIFPPQDVVLADDFSDAKDEKDYETRERRRKYSFRKEFVSGRLKIVFRALNSDVSVLIEGSSLPPRLRAKLIGMIK